MFTITLLHFLVFCGIPVFQRLPFSWYSSSSSSSNNNSKTQTFIFPDIDSSFINRPNSLYLKNASADDSGVEDELNSFGKNDMPKLLNKSPFLLYNNIDSYDEVKNLTSNRNPHSEQHIQVSSNFFL